MILSARGAVPYAPTDILAGLKRIDTRIDLIHRKPPQWGPGATNPRGAWHIVMRWREDDPRRELIKRGEVAPDTDFDFICELPPDCPVAEARAFFERAVAQHRGTGDIGALSRYLHQWNDQVFDAAIEPLREAAAETFDRNKSNPDFVQSVHPSLGTIVKSSMQEAHSARDRNEQSAREAVTAAAVATVSETAARTAADFAGWLPMTPTAYPDRAALERDIATFIRSTAEFAPHPALVVATAQHALDRGTATLVAPARQETEGGKRTLGFSERMRRAREEKRRRDAQRELEQRQLAASAASVRE